MMVQESLKRKPKWHKNENSEGNEKQRFRTQMVLNVVFTLSQRTTKNDKNEKHERYPRRKQKLYNNLNNNNNNIEHSINNGTIIN